MTERTDRELLPCPCCGAEAEHRDDGEEETMEGTMTHYVVCTRCTIQTGAFWDSYPAAVEWNDRTGAAMAEGGEHG